MGNGSVVSILDIHPVGRSSNPGEREKKTHPITIHEWIQLDHNDNSTFISCNSFSAFKKYSWFGLVLSALFSFFACYQATLQERFAIYTLKFTKTSNTDAYFSQKSISNSIIVKIQSLKGIKVRCAMHLLVGVGLSILSVYRPWLPVGSGSIVSRSFPSCCYKNGLYPVQYC